MEKRRRARINASLTELKSLLLEAIKAEGARQNKMEKADILEMAVKHLRHIQRQQFGGDSAGGHPLTGQSSSDTSDIGKYQLGFHACLQQVCQYLDSNREEDVELKTKLLNHLANCMTGADCQTTSSSSSVLSSPSSSSCDIQVPVSPQPGGQLSSSSSSSSDRKSSVHVDSGPILPMSSQSSEISQTDAARPEARPKIHARTWGGDAVQQRVAQSTSDGILHAALTSSSSNSRLVKPRMLSLKPPAALLETRRPDEDRLSSSNLISSTSSGTNQAGSVTEINNNSIILPTLVNMAGPTTFACVQQPHQLQQTQVYQQQQQQQLHPAQLQPQFFPTLADGSSIFTSTNPLQLIPTKTVNGDIAFFLSTTNLLSSSHIPSFSIPIITQPAVSHAQILAQPIPQPAIQIAVSYPADDQQQPVAFIANSVQPIIQPANSSAAVIHSSIPNIAHQTTPLNLSSTTQQAHQQTTHQLMPKRAVALPKAEAEHRDHGQSHWKYASASPAIHQPASSEAGRYTCPPHNIQSPHVDNTNLMRQTPSSEAGRYTCPPHNIQSPHVDNTNLMRQTPSSSWQVTAPADPTSLTFVKQPGSFQPADVHALATDTDSGRSVHYRLPDWQSQLNSGGSLSPTSSNASAQRHFFRPWRE